MPSGAVVIPPLSCSLSVLSSVFTIRGLQWARKGPRLARTEGAYVGQLWFLHPPSSSWPQPQALPRIVWASTCRTQWPEPVRLKPGNKIPLVTAQTELMEQHPAGQDGVRGVESSRVRQTNQRWGQRNVGHRSKNSKCCFQSTYRYTDSFSL